jgi:hypothetical protein
MPKKLQAILNEGLKSRISDKKEYDKVMRALTIWNATVSLSFKQESFVLDNVHHREAYLGLLQMYGYLINCASRGYVATARVIKQWCTDAQVMAVDDRRPDDRLDIPNIFTYFRGSIRSGITPEAAWQLARAGRAIPPPIEDEKKERVEYKEWFKTMTLPPEYREPMSDAHEPSDLTRYNLSNITDWVEKKFRHVYDKFEDRKGQYMGGLKLNTSAAIGQSRKDGGVYGHYMGRAMDKRGGKYTDIPIDNADIPQMPLLNAKGLSRDDAKKLMVSTGIKTLDNLSKTETNRYAIPEGEPDHIRTIMSTFVANTLVEEDVNELLDSLTPELRPKCVPLLLPERGNKYRIASISPAPMVAAGQRITPAILELLGHFSVVNYSLRGDTGIPKPLRQAVATYQSLTEECEFISTDLSKASDFIPHDIAKAVWKGLWLVIGSEFPDYYYKLGEALLDPMELETPKDMDGLWKKTLSSRGILMGLPLTWSILSILNMYASEMAIKDYERQSKSFKSRNRYAQSNLRPYIICGDDMAAYWPKPVSELYISHLHVNCGLKVNRKKTFRSVTGCIFVERCFRIDPKVYRMVIDTPEPPPKRTPEAPTLWDYIEVQLIGAKGSVTRNYVKLQQLVSPQMSAFVLAKRDSADNKDRMPDFAILPDVVSEQYARAKEGWKKNRLLGLIKTFHGDTIKKMKAQGLPLSWPKALGGWGFPGPQTASTEFRKAAAVILTKEADQAKADMFEISTSVAISQLPKNMKQRVKRILFKAEHMDESPFWKGYDGVNRLTRKEVQDNALQRTLTYYATDIENPKLFEDENKPRLNKWARVPGRL